MMTTGPPVINPMSGDETTRHVLSGGTLVLLPCTSANRDQAVFAEPHWHSPGQRDSGTIAGTNLQVSEAAASRPWPPTCRHVWNRAGVLDGRDLFTTSYWYVRLCHAVLGGRRSSDMLSGRSDSLLDGLRSRASSAVMQLPDAIGLVSLREPAPSWDRCKRITRFDEERPGSIRFDNGEPWHVVETRVGGPSGCGDHCRMTE